MDSRRAVVGDSGSEVASLHQMPKVYDFMVPGDEVSQTFFGSAAQDAASQYHTERGLGSTAIVDERSAGRIGAMALTGLLVALGGDPTTIYVGTDAVTEPTQQEKSGLYSFREFERIQFVARDLRMFVRPDFPYLPHDEDGEQDSDAARQPSEAAGRQQPAQPKVGL